MSSYTRQQLENWLIPIKLPAMLKVLDIGGSQNPIQSRICAKGEGSEYKILDLTEPHECKVKPDIKFDLNKISQTMFERIDYEKYFDIAFCLEVSEYWWNPAQAVKNISKLLKKGGLLYISFHFIYPVHNPVDQDYMRYTPRGVEKLLEEAGFEIVEMTPRVAVGDDNLMDWFRGEKMRPALVHYDRHTWIGCLVKAKRI